MEKYRVGELAKVCGVNRRTIDFYTNQGLLKPEERTDGGFRLYGAEALQRVRSIKALQASGLSLQQVRERLALPNAEREVLVHAEGLRAELSRMESEVMKLGAEVACLPPDSAARAAAESSLQATMLCAFGLAQKVAALLSDAHIPLS